MRGVDDNGEHSGERTEKVEYAAERGGPCEPRAPLPTMFGTRSRWCGYQTEHIFGDEERADDLKPGVKRIAMKAPPCRDGVGEHDADPGGDHRMMRPAKEPGGRLARLRLEDLVKTLLAHAPF